MKKYRSSVLVSFVATVFGCDAGHLSEDSADGFDGAAPAVDGGPLPGVSGGPSGGAGGGGAGGGAAGSGGTSDPPPPLPTTGAGFQPSNVSASDATASYERWKSRYVESCGASEARVISNGSETVSEGIAYGMLIAVGHGDRALFDGLWNYYKARRNEHGVMHWKINACTTEVWGQNGATDAEVDAAMALVQAECRWGGYAADAVALMDAFRQWETMPASGLTILLPGDVWGGAGCLNPSYFAPAYYRAFARVDTANAAFWNKFADDSYTVLENAAHAQTGLVPDWTDVNGTPGGSGDGCPRSANYTYDAARTPWRFATDYVWWGTPRAKTWLDRVTEFVSSSGGIRAVGDGYTLDGSRLSSNYNSTFVGAFALGAMAHSQERADNFMGAFVALTQDDAYFQETLRAVYFLLAAGLSTPGC